MGHLDGGGHPKMYAPEYLLCNLTLNDQACHQQDRYGI